MAEIFLDTSVSLDTLDTYDQEKQSRARNTVRRVAEQDTPVISTQILQELYMASTSKLGVEALLAKSIIHSFENSEDLNPGQIIRGVRIENPLQS